jgi:hypothetical protein
MENARPDGQRRTEYADRSARICRVIAKLRRSDDESSGQVPYGDGTAVLFRVIGTEDATVGFSELELLQINRPPLGALFSRKTHDASSTRASLSAEWAKTAPPIFDTEFLSNVDATIAHSESR